MKATEGQINPDDHLDIAHSESQRAARIHGVQGDESSDPGAWLGEVYLLLVQAAERYNPDKRTPFSAWARLTIRLGLLRYRDFLSDSRGHQRDHAPRKTSDANRVETFDLAEDMTDWLDEDHRQVALMAMEGLNTRDIARETGTPFYIAQQRRQKAMRILQRPKGDE